MISVYFIADLPEETEEDWQELYRLFERIEKENWSRFLTFKPVLNPLSPKNYTPLFGASIHPFRDYKSKWENLLRKNGGQWGFRIAETMIWGSWNRVIDVIVNKGGHDAYKIISRMPYKYLAGKPQLPEQAKLSRVVLDECKKIGIYDRLQISEDA